MGTSENEVYHPVATRITIASNFRISQPRLEVLEEEGLSIYDS